MATADVRKKVAERWPSLTFLLKIPELDRLFTKAITQNLSQGAFQSQFMATNWFKSQSESSRRWTVTAHTDPGEANQQRSLMQQGIAAQARQLGISPTRAELQNLREQALRMGVGADDFFVKNALIKLASKGGRTDVGGWTTTADELRQVSLNDYIKPLPDHVNKKWTEWILTGQRTIEDFQAASQREAMKRYPHMVEELKQGLTPGDLVAPYRELIAEELELGDPSQVNMTDPRWRQLVGIKDPKSGKTRMPTESEVVKMARSQDAWGDTSKAREMQYGMVRGLAEMFGERAF